MRCGNKIVSKGDVQAKVIRYCGEPATVQTRFAERGGYLPWYRYRSNRISADQNSGRFESHRSDPAYGRYYRTEVVIEDWVYNFGPHKLMRQVTFENGVVRKVTTLGRGYRE